MPSPNLVFIFTDEQRYDTLAAYGNTRIQMPNLNRLAAQSCVIDRAYVTQPVCTPSRGSMMTGLYPHTHGATGNNLALHADVPCLNEMLPRGQYVSAYQGKWHLGDEVFRQHGFDEWVSLEDMYHKHNSPGRDAGARSTYHHWLLERGFTPKNGNVFGRGEAARLSEEYSKPAFLAEHASRFIRQNRSRPFVLYVNFLEPHMPFIGPRDSQYDRASIPLPPNFNNPPTADQHLKARLLCRLYEEIGESSKLRTEDECRDLIARYWGLCSLVDTHVGTILSTLEQCGLMDNTIIVYTSDHGDMMGSHRLVAKTVMFEEAIRVPLLIRLPGQRQGLSTDAARRIAGPMSHVDLVPTLLDLMGQQPSGHLQGRSWKSALEGQPFEPSDVVVEWNGCEGKMSPKLRDDYPPYFEQIAPRELAVTAASDAVRTILTPDGWKFDYSPMDCHELYNLKADPCEVTNLAAQADCRGIVSDLAGRVRRWQERTGDTAQLPAI